METFREFLGQVENDYSDHQVVNLYLNEPGRKISEIAQATNKSIGEIYRILHSYNVQPNRLRTNQQNVIDFATAGMGISQIAELTGYSSRNVRYILNKLKLEKNA